MRPLFVCLALCATLPAAFPANRYVEAGMPSPDREWQAAEYGQTRKLLAQAPANLPTLADADGAAVLRRLVDPANFNFARNRTLPLNARLGDALALFEQANSIMKLYIAESSHRKDLHTELAMHFAFILQASAAMTELLEEFLPTIQKDEKYEIRMDGLKQMRDGLAQAFSGAEISLGETATYTPADRRIILRAMNETAGKFVPQFSNDYRTELRLRLKRRAAEFSDAEDQRLLNDLIGQISATQN